MGKVEEGVSTMVQRVRLVHQPNGFSCQSFRRFMLACQG